MKFEIFTSASAASKHAIKLLGEMANSSTPFFGCGCNIRETKKLDTLGKDELFTAITTGVVKGFNFKNNIEQYRKTGDRFFKESLPWFAAAIFKDRRCKENIASCQAVILDVDNYGATDAELGQIKKDIFAKLAKPPMLVFISPGKGLKLVYILERSVNEKEYKALWKEATEELEKTLGLKADESSKSIALSCFFSYDPFAIYNKDAEPLKIPQPEEHKVRSGVLFPTTPYRPFLYEKKDSIIGDFELAENIVDYMMKREFTYNEFITIGMGLKNRFGDQGEGLFLKFKDNKNYADTMAYIQSLWNGFKYDGKRTFGSVIFIAKEYGWHNPNKLEIKER